MSSLVSKEYNSKVNSALNAIKDIETSLEEYRDQMIKDYRYVLYELDTSIKEQEEVKELYNKFYPARKKFFTRISKFKRSDLYWSIEEEDIQVIQKAMDEIIELANQAKMCLTDTQELILELKAKYDEDKEV